MGEILLRASPEEEIYVVWSTVPDDVTWIFSSRAEVLADLEQARQLQENNPFVRALYPDSAEKTLQLVDETGCSYRHGASRWGYDAERLRVGANYYLPRARLIDYAKDLLAGDDAVARTWLIRAKHWSADGAL
jgi:hypothetical protein